MLGAVCRPWTNELLCAATDSGTFLQHGDGPQARPPDCGAASSSSSVFHVPHARCPELEAALERLGERMPVDTTRVPCCCCCEGLFELRRCGSPKRGGRDSNFKKNEWIKPKRRTRRAFIGQLQPYLNLSRTASSTGSLAPP